MVFDVDAVATAAATTLATAVATDAWKQLRNRLATLLSSGEPARKQAALATLDGLADTNDRAEHLRRVLRARLLADPSLVEELNALTAMVRTEQRWTGAPVVQTGRAARGGVVVQVGRDATFGELPRP